MADPDAFGGTGGLIAVDRVSGQQTMLARGGLFVEPSNVAFAADGRILVSDTEAFGTGGLIAVDPANGQQTKVVASTVFLRPFGIAVEADGQVVVAYLASVQGSGAVMRVNPANGEHRAVASGFFLPAGVAIDQTGNVVVAEPDEAGLESRLHRVDKGVGASVRATNEPSGAIYTGVALDPAGNIVVASNGVGPNKRLLRFPPTSGAVTTVSEGNKLVSPFGVAVESDGAILVIDRRNGVVRVNPATGAQTVVSTGGSLAGPIGVAVHG